MLRFISALAVVMTAAGWCAVAANARATQIILVALTGPVVALWTVFYMVERRRVERGESSMVFSVELAAQAGPKRAAVIRRLGVAVGVISPVFGLLGIWHAEVSGSMALVLWLLMLTPMSMMICLASFATTRRTPAPHLDDEMMEQIRGRAAMKTLMVENVLMMACIVAAGVASLSLRATLTLFYILFLVGIAHFSLSCQRELRKMVA